MHNFMQTAWCGPSKRSTICQLRSRIRAKHLLEQSVWQKQLNPLRVPSEDYKSPDT